MTIETPNLTELESAALSAPLNLADGHARQQLSGSTVDRLQSLIGSAFNNKAIVPAIEQKFLHSLSRWTGQNYQRTPHYILYSASVAIDAAAKYLSTTARRTGLITPTFDNLPALLTMAKVPILPIAQNRLLPDCDFEYLDGLNLDALMVTVPNNPTGATWSRNSVAEIVGWAADRQVTLVLDLSFRILEPEACFDIVAVAETAGASVICIDDTGKVLSLLDTKVGVLSTTIDIGPALERVCSEILLNVSSLDLMFLTELLASDEVDLARRQIRANRALLRSELARLGLWKARDMSRVARDLSVEWIDLGSTRDKVVQACARRGLHVLPGDPFHWAPGETAGQNFVRIALLRDTDYFAAGIRTFGAAIGDCRSSLPVD